MIGIYQDSFLQYLEDENLQPKLTSKNIVIKCPWCEYNKDRDHYHLHIALDAPMFHCFHATCEQSGTIKKLIKKIQGTDISEQFIDKTELNKITNQKKIFTEDKINQVIIPPLKENMFINKGMYLKKRLKFFNVSFSSIKGLVFDVEEFLKVNHITIDPTLLRIKDYLQSNFIGFVTEHESKIIFRNIDDSHTMRYFKLELKTTYFLDYYKINGGNPNSTKIVLAEGIFDIFSAYYFDILNLKQDTKIYASVLSSKYAALIQSLVFHEQIFKPDIIILSDNGIPLEEYEKLRKFNEHIINTLTVYYNKTGKDFAVSPVIPTKHVITIQNKKYLFGTKYKKQLRMR